MRKLASIGTLAIASALIVGPAMAQTKSPTSPTKLSQAQCTALWNKIDTSKAGSLSQTQARPYVSDFKAVDANSDGKLTQAEFTAGCDKGFVHDKT